MKKAKVIIYLQVAFLALTIIFSTGIAYNNGISQSSQPAMQTPVNLAIQNRGLQVADPAHEQFQSQLAGLDSMIRALEAVAQGRVPAGAQAMQDFSGAYIVEVPMDAQEIALVVMSRNEVPGLEKNIDLSALRQGVNVYLPPVSKTSSTGLVVTEITSEQMLLRSSWDQGDTKASSAGLAEEVEKALEPLISSTANPGTLDEVLDKLKALEAKYSMQSAMADTPEDQQAMEANLQYTRLTKALVESVIGFASSQRPASISATPAGDARQIQQGFTILLDRDSMPTEPLRFVLENLGLLSRCVIQAIDINTIPSELNPDTSMIITSDPVRFQNALDNIGLGKTKLLWITKIENNQYVPIVQLIQHATDILLVNQIDVSNRDTVKNRIMNVRLFLTQDDIRGNIDDYINNPAKYMINIIPAVAPFYEPGQLETLYNMIIQAAQAA